MGNEPPPFHALPTAAPFSGCLFFLVLGFCRRLAVGFRSGFVAGLGFGFFRLLIARLGFFRLPYRLNGGFNGLGFGQCDARFVFGFVAAFGFFGHGGNRRGGGPGGRFGLGRGLGCSRRRCGGRAVVVFRLSVGLGDKPLPLLLQGAADGFLFFFGGGAARCDLLEI